MTIEQFNFAGKKAIVRVDFNVPLDENGNVKRREKKHLLLPLPANEVNTNIYIDKNNPGW